MTAGNRSYELWQRASALPGGKWLFSRVVCWKAPYFASIQPRLQSLRPGHAVVTLKKRRKVQNHIGTVHAIAICNLAEFAAGTLIEITIPPSCRWIPRGMTVEYLAKAGSNLTATARIEPMPAFDAAVDVPVQVDVRDDNNVTVVAATITMYVTPRPPR